MYLTPGERKELVRRIIDVVSLKLVKHGLELELADGFLVFVILLKIAEELLEVVLGDWLVLLIDSYRSHSVQVLDLFLDLLLALSSFHHRVVLEDDFEEIGAVMFVLCDGALSSRRLVKDTHTLVHIEIVVIERLLADRVKVVK